MSADRPFAKATPAELAAHLRARLASSQAQRATLAEDFLRAKETTEDHDAGDRS